jgi:starch phosphorylase
MYRRGFFRQTIDADGHQEHAYPDFELARLPILRVLDRLGEPLTVSVQLPGRDLYAAVWLAQVGRVPVLLLDTDVPDNDDSDRPITHILYVRGREMRLHQELVLGVGVERDTTQFDMTAFSLRLTNGANAVSQLHGHTANGTWFGVAPHEILGLTNGVHTSTWLGQPMRDVLERYTNADLDTMDHEPEERRFWERTAAMPTADLWEAHQRQKLELAIFARGRLRSQFARHGEAPATLEELEEVLDPGILTIGFARRFATYKRAALLFTDLDRLARLVWDTERPMQIIFAGKAHPADRPGQGVIQDIFGRSRSPKLRGRVFIMEDYDIRIARFLVQGVDVWLNNPRRPLEASGTSGMKAAANGVLNVSVLDGWWDEGFVGDNGWAIGGRETNPDEGAQDWADAQDLYRILEEELIPAYYERDADGLPARWAQLMRNSIASSIWRFSTTRMLHEYTERLYLPAAGVDVPLPAAGLAAPVPVPVPVPRAETH